MFVLTAGQGASCNVNGVTHGDEHADNYHPTQTQCRVVSLSPALLSDTAGSDGRPLHPVK